MKVYLLIETTPYEDEVLGVFDSPGAAMASDEAPKPHGMYEWQECDSGWVFAERHSVNDDAPFGVLATHHIDEWEVQS